MVSLPDTIVISSAGFPLKNIADLGRVDTIALLDALSYRNHMHLSPHHLPRATNIKHCRHYFEPGQLGSSFDEADPLEPEEMLAPYPTQPSHRPRVCSPSNKGFHSI